MILSPLVLFIQRKERRKGGKRWGRRASEPLVQPVFGWNYLSHVTEHEALHTQICVSIVSGMVNDAKLSSKVSAFVGKCFLAPSMLYSMSNLLVHWPRRHPQS